MSKRSVLNHVPKILREEIADYNSTIPAVLGPKLIDESMEESFNFIQGAIGHQESIRVEEPGKSGEMEKVSKWFKGTIVSVDREKRGKIGEKAKITFEDSRSGKEQSIYTGWVQYNFRWNIPYWELALSQTLEEEAEGLIGKEALLRKSFVYGVETAEGGNKVRFLADISPVYGSNADDVDEEDDEEDEEDQPLSRADIDDYLSDGLEDLELEDGDYEFIISVEGLTKAKITSEVAAYLDIPKKELFIPDDPYDETWEYAIQVLSHNLD